MAPWQNIDDVITPPTPHRSSTMDAMYCMYVRWLPPPRKTPPSNVIQSSRASSRPPAGILFALGEVCASLCVCVYFFLTASGPYAMRGRTGSRSHSTPPGYPPYWVCVRIRNMNCAPVVHVANSTSQSTEVRWFEPRYTAHLFGVFLRRGERECVTNT